MRNIGKRNLYVFLITIVFLIGMNLTTAFAAQQSDISNHWAKDQVLSWVDKGLISGYANGSFKPDNNITRAEFMALVNRAFGYQNTVEINYSDVPAGLWFTDTIAQAKAGGYIGGYQDRTMKPHNPISRQEAAAIIMRIKELKANAAAADKFSDAPSIPAWSKGAVGAVVTANIMGGYPNGSFKAESYIKRAEAVVALSRAINYQPIDNIVYDQAGTYGPPSGKETIKGNVTIKAKKVTLQNLVIEGDLTVDRAVGNGNATLKNITIKGNTYIYGGGENSVYFIDTQAGKTYVLKDDGPVRIVVSGTSEISQLIAQSSIKVEEVNLTGIGFEGIVVENNSAGKLEINLTGIKVESLEIKSEHVNVIADRTTEVATMLVKADNISLKTENGTSIGTLVADGNVAVTGKGDIARAEVNVSGVSFETKPTDTKTAIGVSEATISGSGSSGGGGGGSSSSSTAVTSVTMDKTTASINVGASVTLTATVLPDNATTKTVTWSSSDTEIATVDNNGNVTGIKEGTATVTVTTTDGKKTAVCEVTVMDPSSKTIIAVDPQEKIINIAKGTSKEDLKLPTKIDVTITGGIKKTVDVVWDAGTLEVTRIKEIIEYNPNQAGTYNFIGGLKNLPEGVTNPNEMTANVKVIVLSSLPDNTPPIIKLLGNDTVAIHVGDSYVDAGATAIDDNTGDITDDIKTTIVIDATGGNIGTVDTSAGRSYTIKYNVKDIYGNNAEEVTRKVLVIEKVREITIESNMGITDIIKDETLQMQAIVGRETATNKEVTWSVDPGTGTATISETGLLTATSVGTVTVKATAKDNSGVVGTLEITIHENEIPVTSVEIDQISQLIPKGTTFPLVATVIPYTASNQGVTWSSSDESVATVDSEGNVTGFKAGNATITVTTVDGGKTASCEVTVWAESADKNIESVKPITDIGVANGTEISAANLPTSVTLVLTDASEIAADVTWDNGDPVYNENTEGTYTFTGTITPPANVTNTDNIKASVKVIVGKKELPADTEINIAAIPGVTPPVTGAIPVTSITETAQYTGTVIWSPTIAENGKFAAGTEYEATIMLSPKAGYTFTGVTQNFFTVAGATALNADNAGIVLARFPATDAEPSVELTSLTISQGTLSPGFSGLTYNYKASVANAIDSVRITAELDGATITGDTGVKTLVEGANTFAITVTKEGFTTKTYTILINRANADSDVPVTGIALDKTGLKLLVGDQTGTLVATVLPENATNKAVTWYSDDKTVATVDGTGVVTPVAAGTAYIHVQSDENDTINEFCRVTVHDAELGIFTVAGSDVIGLANSEVNEPTTDAGAILVYNFDNPFGISAIAKDLEVGTTVVVTVNEATISDPANYGVKVGDVIVVTLNIQDLVTKYFKVTIIAPKSNDATLSNLTVDGTQVVGFNAATLTYNVELPAGTTEIPSVVATVTDTGKAIKEVTNASALPGSTTVLVTAEDGTTKTYTINFTVAKSYTITIAKITGGTANISIDNSGVAEENAVVTVWVENIEPGKQFKSITIKYADSETIAVTEEKAGEIYTFTMPAKDVTIQVELKAVSEAPATPKILSAICKEDSINEDEEAGLGRGDTLTITFDVPTNKAQGWVNGEETKEAVDSVIDWGAKSFGSYYKGYWLNDKDLRIQCITDNGATFAAGDSIMIKAGADVRTKDGLSAPSTATAVTTGDFEPYPNSIWSVSPLTGSLVEAPENNGSFRGTELYTKDYISVNFEKTIAEDIAKEDITANNLPNGLDFTIIKKTPYVIDIYLTGSATNHAAADSITNLSFTFAKDKVKSGDTDLTTKDIALTFVDKFKLRPFISNVSSGGFDFELWDDGYDDHSFRYGKVLFKDLKVDDLRLSYSLDDTTVPITALTVNEAGKYTVTADIVTGKIHFINISNYEDRFEFWKNMQVNIQPPAPSGLSGVAPTSVDGSDGKITGINPANTMQYRIKSDPAVDWITAENGVTELTGLIAGTYQVMIKGSPGIINSKIAEVVVPAFGTAPQE